MGKIIIFLLTNFILLYIYIPQQITRLDNIGLKYTLLIPVIIFIIASIIIYLFF